jgi:hypothetical protein
MRRPLLHLLVVPLLCSLPAGCVLFAAGAGAGVGYLVSKEVLPNDVHTARVRLDVDEVWPRAKEVLGFLVDPTHEVRALESPRRATAVIDGKTVTVVVEAFDVGQSIIRVEAVGPLGSDSGAAEDVLNRILDKLPKR